MKSNRGATSAWSILLVIIIIAGALLWGLWPEGKNFEQATGLDGIDEWNRAKDKIYGIKNSVDEKLSLKDEKARIDQWIIDKGLNRYGDPIGTMYAGGTPLFDEKTGAMTDRYEYIIKRYPDKPWLE